MEKFAHKETPHESRGMELEIAQITRTCNWVTKMQKMLFKSTVTHSTSLVITCDATDTANYHPQDNLMHQRNKITPALQSELGQRENNNNNPTNPMATSGNGVTQSILHQNTDQRWHCPHID